MQIFTCKIAAGYHPATVRITHFRVTKCTRRDFVDGFLSAPSATINRIIDSLRALTHAGEHDLTVEFRFFIACARGSELL